MPDTDKNGVDWYYNLSQNKVSADELRTGFHQHGTVLAHDGQTMLIVSHGGKDGRLMNKTAVTKLVEKYSKTHEVMISCCYPAQVAKHNPDLARLILNPQYEHIQHVGFVNAPDGRQIVWIGE